MALSLGRNAYFYLNTGTSGTPVWSLMANVKDVKASSDADKADVSTRGTGGWAAEVKALKKLEVSVNCNHDLTDTNYKTLFTAAFGDTVVDIAICDTTSLANTGGVYIRAICQVTGEKGEALKDAQTTDFKIFPTYSTAYPPTVNYT